MALDALSTGLYLQRIDDAMIWEEVDLYTWDNWQKALLKNGSRYTGNRVRKDGIHIEIIARGLASRDVAIIARFCGVRENEAPGSVTGGFVRRPEFIRFMVRNKVVLHENGGGDYICKGKAATPEDAA